MGGCLATRCPRYEVPSFDRFVGEANEESQRAADLLMDWPEIWAVVTDFGVVEEAFAVGQPLISRDAAEAEARLRAQELEKYNGTASRDAPERREGCTTLEEFLASGETWAILYAPLTPATFGLLCQMDRGSENDFENAVVELQRNHAWRLTMTAALALRGVPGIVRRRIFAFAFSTRALGRL